MTQPALSLVPSAAAEPSDPIAEEKLVIAEYVKRLKERGFCKLDNSASNGTRLFNRFTQEVLPLSFIENDFVSWLHAKQKKCSYRSVPYITYTLPHVIGSRFIPEAIPYFTHPDTGCRYVNTYTRYKPSTDSAEKVSDLFLDYLARLFPIDEERHISVQWLSHSFQRPAERPSWHLMLLSEAGTGKGFLVQAILHPLLKHTSVVADYSKVMGRFSGVLQDNLLVLLDDCKARSEATQTQLKSILSEERAYVEQKHLAGGMVDTFTRFILASNEYKPLTLDADERRWYIPARLTHRVDRHETAAFIRDLKSWLDLPGSLDAVYRFFMEYSLEGFNHKDVPESAGLSAIVGMSKSPYADFLEHYVTETRVFRYAEMVEEMKREGLSKPGDAHMVHLLREVGYTKSQPRINGKAIRLCHPAGMTLEKIRAEYEETEAAITF